MISIRRFKTDQKVAQKTGVIRATMKAPVLLQSAEADVMAVGKIAELTWEMGDSIELVHLELEVENLE